MERRKVRDRLVVVQETPAGREELRGVRGPENGVLEARLEARWIAAITQRETLVRILEHLGLESVAPPPAPPRAPPQLELSWEGA